MNIVLTGASGFIGGQIARALAAAGHRVTPISRRHGFDFRHLRHATDWMPLLQGVDAVINAVGIIGEARGQSFDVLHTAAPLALFRACAQTGVRRVLQISALGADATAFSAYHLSKRAADDGLRSLDLDWFVLRPSLVYGPSGTSTQLFMRLAAAPLIPVLGDGQQALQPVHVSDVVATVQRCLASPTAQQTLDLVGPEVIAFDAWLQRMRAAQGLPPAKRLRIPMALAMAGAWLGRWLSPMLHPDNLRMLQAGNCADVAPLARFLGRMPLRMQAELFFADSARVMPAGSL